MKKVPNAEQLILEQSNRDLCGLPMRLGVSDFSARWVITCLGLITLKMLSDKFECDAMLLMAFEKNLGTAPELAHSIAYLTPEFHQFFVEPDCRWGTISEVIANRGSAYSHIWKAFRQLISPLIEFDISPNGSAAHHTAIVTWINDVLPNNDPAQLNKITQALIKSIPNFRFSADQLQTEFIVKIANPRKGWRIYDPACGTGALLIECAQKVVRNGLLPIDLSVYGKTSDLEQTAICKLMLLLDCIQPVNIIQVGTVTTPSFSPDINFDCILCDVQLAQDPQVKERTDIPLLDHVCQIMTMQQNALAVLVIPRGFLLRGGQDLELRKNLIERDLLEAVITLPNQLGAIIVLKTSKPEQRKNKILFVHGDDMVMAQSYDAAVAAYYSGQGSNCLMVDLKTVEHANMNLLPSNYLAKLNEKPFSVQQYLEEMNLLELKRDSNRMTILRLIDGLYPDTKGTLLNE